MSDYEDWSTVAASNVDAPPDGAPERHDRDKVNDIFREQFAAHARFWRAPDWKNVVKDYAVSQASATQVTIAAFNATALFTVGTKVRIRSAASGTAYAFVSAVSFSSPDTLVTVSDFDAGGLSAVPADANGIDAYFLTAGAAGHGLGKSAFGAYEIDAFEIPAGTTTAAIQAAITAAESAGRIVLLDAESYEITAPLVVNGPVRIWGRGINVTTLTATNNLDDDIFSLPDDASDIEIAHMTIDHDRANQAAGSCIHAQDNVKRVWLHHLQLLNAFLRSINFDATSTSPGTQRYEDIRIEHVIAVSSGASMISISDPNDGNVGISIRDCHLINPGLTFAVAKYACIDLATAATVANVELELAAASVPDACGIHLRPVSSGGSPDGGSYCQITNFRVTGPPSNARGVLARGRHCQIANGTVALTGAAAVPIDISGLGATPDEAGEIKLMNLELSGGAQNSVSATALRCEFHGCTFRDQTSNALTIDGDDTLVIGCLIEGAGGIGIAVRNGANDCQIKGNVLRDVAGVGIHVQSGASRTTVSGNSFDNVTGAVITDEGTSTKLGENIPDDDVVFVAGASQLNIGNTLTALTGMEGVAFPRGGANGVRRYEIEAYAVFGNGSAAADFAIRVGTNGDVTDSAVSTVTGDASTTGAQFGIAKQIVTPAAGALATASIENIGVAGDSLAHLAQDLGSVLGASFLRIRYLDG